MNKIVEIKARLEYIRGEIEAERVSYSEIVELEELSDYIEDDDILLKEWAGIPEFDNEVDEPDDFRTNKEQQSDMGDYLRDRDYDRKIFE